MTAFVLELQKRQTEEAGGDSNGEEN